MKIKSKGIFISSTDTNVGKTYTSILLAKYLIKKGVKTGYLKPIETGCERININGSSDLQPSDAKLVKNILKLDDDIDLICPFRFENPLSPYDAMKYEKKIIDIDKIKDSWVKLTNKYEVVIIEGAGGLLVPVTKDFFMIDFPSLFNIPCLLVSDNKLGTINHTFLSINQLKMNNTQIQSVIFNNTSNNVNGDISKKFNMSTIKEFSGNIPIFEIPYINDMKSFNDIDMIFE